MGVPVELALAALILLGPGALAPADDNVLERVQARRITNGWGLSEPAPAGAALIAVEDCALLGKSGHALVAGIGWVPVYTVDCQQREHRPLSELGIVADVNRPELGHRRAVIVLHGG